MDQTPLRDEPEDASNDQQGTDTDTESIISLLEALTISDHERVEHVDDVPETNSTAPSHEMTEEERADFELAMLLQAQEDQGFEEHDQDLPPEEKECACGEIYTCLEDVVVLNCGCVRCPDCLNQNVKVGLESKSNFPPKCHGPIDINDILHFLQPNVLARWAEVRAEYTDVAPVYCAAKGCSKYLEKDTFVEEGKWALCGKCDVKTCPACLHLQNDHDKGVCPERLAKMDKELMIKEGWKECPKCKNMIEKSDGCDHMVCECDQEFCYNCGRPYDGGLPCNCHGNNEWVEEDPDENDPAMQQQLMEELANARRGRVRRPRRGDLIEDDEFSDDDEEESVDEESGEESEDQEESDDESEEESGDDSEDDSSDDNGEEQVRPDGADTAAAPGW